jgi:hypothetical protein
MAHEPLGVAPLQLFLKLLGGILTPALIAALASGGTTGATATGGWLTPL